MSRRVAGVLVFLAWATSARVGGAGEAKPLKGIARSGDGLGIVYEVRGKGDTALVFLHGWCGDREYWKHQVDAFAGDYRVVTLDLGGHGESGKDRKEWTVDSLAGDVEAVVKKLGLKRVIIVGHSMGGPIGLAAAKKMPGTVVAVIGADTLHNVEFKWPEEMSKKFFEALQKDFKGTLGEGLKGMLPEKASADLRKWLLARAEAQDPKMALALMRNLSRADVKTLLKEAKVPVRCINAAASGFKYGTKTEPDINNKYGDFAAVIIEGVGHYPMLERPEEFNKQLRMLLKKLAASK